MHLGRGPTPTLGTAVTMMLLFYPYHKCIITYFCQQKQTVPLALASLQQVFVFVGDTLKTQEDKKDRSRSLRSVSSSIIHTYCRYEWRLTQFTPCSVLLVHCHWFSSHKKPQLNLLAVNESKVF